MKPILGVLVLGLSIGILVGSNGLPQIAPIGDTHPASATGTTSLASPSLPPPSPVSPLSQWLSLVVPPIATALPGGGKKKKKLLPGPPPPEGTPEAPWVTWTRMKVSSAMAPPVPPGPPPPSPPPSPVQSSDSDPGAPPASNASTPEPSVWIQWTQMKLPLTNPLSPAPAQVAPWDAWTNLKSPVAVSQPDSTVSKRMAPDRFLASTMAPRISTMWPPKTSQLGGSSQQESSSWPSSPDRVVSPVAAIRNSLPSRPPSSSQVSGSGGSSLPPALISSLAASLPAPVVKQLLSNMSPEQIVGLGVVNPSLAALAQAQQEAVLGPWPLPPSLGNAHIGLISLVQTPAPAASSSVSLKSIPTALLAQIRAKASPQEINELIQNVIKAEKSPESQTTIAKLLPPTLISKLPPQVAPLVLQPLPPLAQPVGVSKLIGSEELSSPVLSAVPEPILTQILLVATPQEVAEVEEILLKLSQLPPAQKPLVKEVQVGMILPASLLTKLPSPVGPLLSAKLVSIPSVPPVDLKTVIPEPVLSQILAKATADEVATLKENVAKVQVAPGLPPPSISALLPISLLTKLPAVLAPQLMKKVIIPSTPVHPPIPTSISLLPEPLAKEVLEQATPTEVAEIAEKLRKLSEVAPVPSLPVGLLLPPTLLPKLSQAVVPLLQKQVVIPSPVVSAPTLLSTIIPEPILTAVKAVATPEEEEEIEKIIESLETEAPTQKPLGVLISPLVLAKLPPSTWPLLGKEVVLPAKATTAAIPSALALLPEPVASAVVATATPAELNEIVATLAKVKALKLAEEPLLSELKVKSVLPSTLLPRLPPAVGPLLSKPLQIKPVPTGILPPILSVIPEPVLSSVLGVASPVEINELVETLKKVEAVPPEKMPAIAPVELKILLPPTLLSKLPPTLAPLLEKKVKIVPGKAPPPTFVLPTVPLPTKEIPTVLEAIPGPVLKEILAMASPEEMKQFVEAIEKLETLPPGEKPLISKLEVGTLLPPSLIPKLPPALAPLLKTELVMPPTPVAAEDIIPPSVVSVITEPLLSTLVAVASPPELAEVETTVEKLEALPAELVSELQVQDLLPPSLLAKLPLAAKPFVETKIAILPPKLPALAPAIVPSFIPPVLTAIPEPILSTILAVATPPELAELESTISKLETLPIDQKQLISELDVETLIPPTLLAKLPPALAPLLAKPLMIAPSPTDKLPPILTVIPEPILSSLLSVASPLEINELVETLQQVEAVPPEQMPAIAPLELKTLLPPSLIAKLPLTVAPLLEKKVKIVPGKVPIPAVVPTEIVPSVLEAIPGPVMKEVFATATPEEMKQLVETIEKLEALPPVQKPLISKLEVATLLPPGLLAKLPPSLAPLLEKKLVKVVPSPTFLLPTEVVPTILEAIPGPILKEVLTIATPEEMKQLVETIEKLEALPPAEKLLISKLEVETLLPPSLIAKLSPTLAPLLEKKLEVVPATVAPPTEVVPTVLESIPSPVLKEVLAVASPEEMKQLVDTIEKLEALPPTEKPIITKLEVETLLPPSLLAKLPPTLAPFLEKKLEVVPPKVPPPTSSIEVVPTVLETIPGVILKEVLAVASPEEMKQFVETIEKLEAIPHAEKPLIAKLEVETLLPPSLLAKLPPTLAPLLAKKLEIVPAKVPPSTLTPGPIPIQEVPSVLEAIPAPVLKEMLAVASPVEMKQFVETIEKLEALSPPEKPFISNLEIETLLPLTLLAKLPPALAPLLEKKLEVIPAKVPPPTEVFPSVLDVIPGQLLNEVLKVASPEEMKQFVETIEKLEALPPAQKPLISKLEVETLLPPSLIAKLPPTLAPLLAKNLEFAPTKLPPSTIVPIKEMPSVLEAIPSPVLKEVLAVATPEELKQLVETIGKLETLSPAEKPLISKLEVGTLLPPSLLGKLPPALAPLLKTELVMPPTPVAAENIIPPSVIPEPLLSTLVSVASPPELAELETTVEKLKALPAELVSELQIQELLPPSLLAKLPPSLAPLLETNVAVLPPTLPAPPPTVHTSIPPALSVIPEPVLSSILAEDIIPPSVVSVIPEPLLSTLVAVASPPELAELKATIQKLEALPTELVSELQIQELMPPSLLAKLPPEVKPILETNVAILPPPPTGVVVPTVPSTIPPVLSVIPEPVLSTILAVATPPELTELESTIAKLEALPVEEKALISELNVESLIPPTLLAKLPPALKPLLETKLEIPESIVPGVVIPPPLVPGIIPPQVAPGVIPPPAVSAAVVPPSVLTSIPPALLGQILAVATPAEVSELINTISQVEAVPPEMSSLLSDLKVISVLPPSLIPKIPAEVQPLLATKLDIAKPETATVASENASPPPPISIIPPPVLTAVVEVATPAELNELIDTVTKLEAIPPEQVSLIPPFPVVSLLPPTLLAKLPPALAPLLAQTVQLPSEVPISLPPQPFPALPPASLVPPPPPPGVPTEAPWLTYIKSEYGIPEPVSIPTEATPALEAPTVAPPSPAEEKLLTKWAKIILEKTGRPVKAGVPAAEEVPPIQAAWTEWIQLQLNETEKSVTPPTTTALVAAAATPPPPSREDSDSTTVNWTKWLKLKENTTNRTPVPSPASLAGVVVPPGLDVTTESPEKSLLEWLEALEKTSEQPPQPDETGLNPETEAKVVQLLKQYGIENVPLTPEQVKELVAAVERPEEAVAPSSLVAPGPPPPAAPVPTPVAIPPPVPQYIPGYPPMSYAPLDTKPTMGFWPPPMTPYLPYTGPIMSPFIPPGPAAPPAANVPPPPTVAAVTPLSIPNLANVLEEQAENAVEPSEGKTTPSTIITANELESLTPTKFTALLKQILKDCNRTNGNILVSRSAKGGWGGGPPVNYFAMKNKWKGKGKYKGRYGRALLPIPSQGVALPIQQDSSSPSSLLPMPSLSMPKVETAGTVLDPAYWAAQKSLFLSKLFSTLAKVALNDSQSAVATTPNPKEQLTKQINTVLLGDMTRSVKHHPHPEDYEQEEEDQEDEEEGQQEVNENELVTNDNSEPNLPKEPDNPLHKLFKFGVQKTVLSDLSTPAPIYSAPPAAPVYIYYTTTPQPDLLRTTPSLDKQKEMVERLQQTYQHNKKESRKKKKKSKSHPIHKAKVSKPSPKHHPRFRKPTISTSSTTTENPVDFDLLAKALLLDNKAKK